jgi:hypothetical protein
MDQAVALLCTVIFIVRRTTVKAQLTFAMVLGLSTMAVTGADFFNERGSDWVTSSPQPPRTISNQTWQEPPPLRSFAGSWDNERSSMSPISSSPSPYSYPVTSDPRYSPPARQGFDQEY